MFGKHFYNKNIRNIIILFGTVFNDITIKRVKSNGVVDKHFKVPIAYGPAQKYLTILEQGKLGQSTGDSGIYDDSGKTSSRQSLTLPRMSFEITTMTYDATRKLQTTKRVKEAKPLGTIDSIKVTGGGSGYTSAPTVTLQDPPTRLTATATAVLTDGKVTSITLDTAGIGYTTIPNVTITGGGGSGATATANVDANTSTLITAYTPVPYNFDIDLSIMVKNSDDGTQILEQILPFFTPEYHVTLNEMATVGVKRDIPIIMNAMNTEDSYEGDMMTRRALIHTLSFTVQGYLYGPTKDMGIIREVDANIGANFNDKKDTNIDIKPDPLTADPDDDFGFTTTTTEL
jgi:hypothetical protein